jgi:prepilin-type N-terminal cleavage/methylation domain-containing protein
MTMNNKNAGFSLLEVLVAFSILSAAIVLSMTSYSQGLRNLKTAEMRLNAMSVLDHVDLASPQNAIFDPQRHEDFRVETTVATMAEKPFGGLEPKLVTLHIYSKDGGSEPVLEVSTISITLETE